MIGSTILSLLISSGQVVDIPKEQLECLALNVYYEARSESELGKIAVTHVVLNRVKSNKYPNTPCDVIKKSKYENGSPKKGACHFSWFCDGKPDKPVNTKAWTRAVKSAYDAYVLYLIGMDVTSNSVMYHATYVKPYWKSSYKRITRIDNHIFYGEK